MHTQLSIFEPQTTGQVQKTVVNVASIPQRSPFRYPGGKTWLIPIVRKWLKQDLVAPKQLIEPFAGGGIVSLTAAFENLAEQITMVEKDEEIAAVWQVIFNGKCTWLANKVYGFELTAENIRAELENDKKQIHDIAFCTILKNRVFHGGIITKGAGFIKNGENGKGLHSRWYPKTLRDRILAIGLVKERMNFIAGDAFEVLNKNQDNTNAYFFIDPPYTKAGKRLYTHFQVDNDKLFEQTSKLKGRFMLTYDDSEEVRYLAGKYNLEFRTVPMKTTHHMEKSEIIITDNLRWWM